MAFNSLKDKAKQLNNLGGVPFMEGREKGELPKDTIITLDDYGFVKNEDGDYVVMSFMEYPGHFFFGGKVVTEKIRELDSSLEPGEKEKIETDGIPVLFGERANKKGKRTYTTLEFFPEEVEE